MKRITSLLLVLILTAACASAPPPAPEPRPQRTHYVHVELSSSPAPADVYLDGKFVGMTPAAYNLPVGEYEVVVRKDGYTSWARKVTLTPYNSRTRLVAELERK